MISTTLPRELAETALSALVEQSMAGIYIIQDGRFRYANARLLEIFGCTEADLAGCDDFLAWAVDERDRAAMQENICRCSAASGRDRRHDIRCRRRDGAPIHVEVQGAAAEYDGRPAMIGTLIDITDRRRAEDALRESGAMLREITAELGEGIYVLDRAGKLTFMNKAAERMLGWQEGELLGRNAHMAFHYQRPDGSFVAVDDCPVYMAIHSAETYRVQEDWFTRKDGTLFPVSFVAAPLHRGEEVAGSVAAFQDISARQEIENRLDHLAHYDLLTGLPNRALLLDCIERVLVPARREQGSVALLCLELDGLKSINDRLGHDAGDILLKQVAGWLAHSARDADTVARPGGGEFAILLAGVKGEAGPARVAEKVIEALSQPVEIGGERLRVGASIGIALYPAHGEDTQTLMRHAEMAMCQAKEAGRNGYRYYEGEIAQ